MLIYNTIFNSICFQLVDKYILINTFLRF